MYHISQITYVLGNRQTRFPEKQKKINSHQEEYARRLHRQSKYEQQRHRLKVSTQSGSREVLVQFRNTVLLTQNSVCGWSREGLKQPAKVLSLADHRHLVRLTNSVKQGFYNCASPLQHSSHRGKGPYLPPSQQQA